MFKEALISKVVKISTGYATQVDIERDFFFNKQVNTEKLRAYVPLKSHRKAFFNISQGLHVTSTRRVYLLTGAYGTGKSHLGLVLANYYTLPSIDSQLEPIFDKMKGKDPVNTDFIFKQRDVERPFFLVLCTGYDPQGFNHSLIRGLHKSIERARDEDIEIPTPDTSYKEIVEKIEKWEKEYPDVYKKFEIIVKEHEMTIPIFKDRIGRELNQETYELFLKIHPRVTGGAPFIPFYSKGPAEVYQSFISSLKRNTKYQGIIVIFDEFGKHLEHLASDPNSAESLDIQDFAQYCIRSGEEQCHFIIIAHGSLRVYAKERRSYEEWKKVTGRFVELNLTGIDEGYEDLLDTIIIQPTESQKNELWDKVCSSTEWNDLYKVIEDLKLYEDKRRDWIFEKIIEGAYPLHPLAAFCLVRISEAVGQYQRTMFTFLEDEEEGLNNYINSKTIFDEEERLQLFTVDLLFDYFERAIQEEGKKEKRYQAIYDGFIEAKAKVPKESPLGIRILKAIGVLRCIAQLQTTSEILSYALNLPPFNQPDMEKLLEEMKKSEALKRRPSTGEWLFKKGYEGYDLEDDVNKALELVQIDNLSQFLNKRFHPKDIEAKKYNEEYSMDRTFKGKFVSPTHLSNIHAFESGIERDFLDGMVLYVICEDEESINQAKKLARNFKNPQLVVAIPKESINVSSDINKLVASDQLKNKTPYNMFGEAHEDLDQFTDDLIEGISGTLEQFQNAENLSWFTAYGINDALSRNEEVELIDELAKKIFKKTPRITLDRIAYRWGAADSMKAQRRTAIEKILNEEHIQIKESGSIPAPDNIIIMTLKENGLLKYKESRGTEFAAYEIDLSPKNKEIEENAQNVLNAIQNHLLQKDKPIPIESLVKKLRAPEFGISLMTIELFLSTFFSKYKDQIAVIKNFEKGQHRWEIVSISGDSVYQFVHKPEDYHTYFYELSPVQSKYLNELKKYIAWEKGMPTNVTMVEGTADIVLKWYSDLPTITKSMRKFRDEYAEKFLKALSKEEETRLLLFIGIPNSVGFDKPYTGWRETDVNDLIKRVKSVVEECNNYAEIYAQKIIAEVGIIFNAKGATEKEIDEAIRSWYNNLPQYIKAHTFLSNDGALQKAAVSDASVRERFLEGLPKNMGLGLCLNWTEDLLSRYVLEIIRSKSNIESYKPATKTLEPKELKVIEETKQELKQMISKLLRTKKITKEQLRDILLDIIGEICK